MRPLPFALLALVAALGCGGNEVGSSDAQPTESLSSALMAGSASAVTAACAGESANHGRCVSCVTRELAALKRAGAITGREHGALLQELTENGCGCPVEGAMTCDPASTGFLTCADGTWVYRACAPGTACTVAQEGSILCDWP